MKFSHKYNIIYTIICETLGKQYSFLGYEISGFQYPKIYCEKCFFSSFYQCEGVCVCLLSGQPCSSPSCVISIAAGLITTLICLTDHPFAVPGHPHGTGFISEANNHESRYWLRRWLYRPSAGFCSTQDLAIS